MNTITITQAADLFESTFGQGTPAADYMDEIGAVTVAGIGGGFMNGETSRPDKYIAFYQAYMETGSSYRFATSGGAGIVDEDNDMGAFAVLAESCGVRLA